MLTLFGLVNQNLADRFLSTNCLYDVTVNSRMSNGTGVCPGRGADLHVAQLMPLPPTSRLVLPFWYRLSWVVPDKRPLNGCCCCHRYKNVFYVFILVTFLRFLTFFFIFRTFLKIKNVENLLSMQANSEI